MAISLQLLLLLSLLLCEPTESQNNVGGIGCYGNLNTIALREGLLDSSEILLAREYTLCSGLYTIGTLDYDYQLGNGQDMLSLRPNMHVKCGETGARDNSCLISGGDVQVDGTNLFTVGDGTLDNVTLEGLTFISAGRHMAWLNKPGSVLFKDCVFRDSMEALSPVLLDFFDPKAVNNELEVTFYECLFEQNVFAGQPAQPALVVGNSRQNRLIFEKCQFTDNDMVANNTNWRENSFLVESSGPLSMIGNCFQNNQIGYAPVSVYNEEYFFVNNYNDRSEGRFCPFASRFETASQFDNSAPLCSSFDADTCATDSTSTPTLAPTSSPTAPTSSPSSSPSGQPSEAPSDSLGPSVDPSTGPTFGPTVSPSTVPSGVPSMVPSFQPSGVLSIAPVMQTLSPATSLREITTSSSTCRSSSVVVGAIIAIVGSVWLAA